MESLRAVANTRAHEHSTGAREALEWQAALHSSLSLGVGSGLQLRLEFSAGRAGCAASLTLALMPCARGIVSQWAPHRVG